MNTKNTVRKTRDTKIPTAARAIRSARKITTSSPPAGPNGLEPVRASAAIKVEKVADEPPSEPEATVTARKPNPPTKPARTTRRALEAAVAAPVGLKTSISVKADVGFGNQVFLRGEGADLNWDKGILAACSASDLWTVTLPGLSGSARFKVLVNDSVWNVGEDYAVNPGQCITIEPRF